MRQMNLFMKQKQTHRQTTNMVTKGGGMNKEFGIKIYTYIYSINLYINR